eukprot:s1673_g3.t1
MADKAAIPAWNGDPTTFEEYATAAKWFERGTKSSERNLVVARLWGQLSGAAKSVVRYLEPEQYEGEDGLRQFLDVLRASPLQQLPIPDSFARLEKWHGLKRGDKESIAELIVKEEQLFTELQQSLTRARKDRMGVTGEAASSPQRTGLRNPPSTPSQSPTAAATTGPPVRDPQQSMYPSLPSVSHSDFFEDELRGYRLLRASRISHQEKQNVLVQTNGSTSFFQIRRALRTLYAEESERSSQRPSGRIWYEDWDEQQNYDDDATYDAWWSEWDDWSEWSPQTYWYDDADWWNNWGESFEDDEIVPNDQSTDPEEVQLSEAYALASEAHRTLKDAREAVRRVRQARGYYAPESNSGKGIVPSASASPSGSPSTSPQAKGKSKSLGPCFRCGLQGHTYQNCPDRFSNPKGKGKSKFGFKGQSAFGKGKFGKFGKGKSMNPKGKTYFVDLACVLSVQWDDAAVNGRAPTRAILESTTSQGLVPEPHMTSMAQAPPMTKGAQMIPPETIATAPDAMMSNMAAENQELRDRVEIAETAAAEAMKRTEILASEAARQQEMSAQQNAELENLRKMSQKKEPKKTPEGSPESPASGSWQEIPPGQAVPVPSDSDEEAKEKKRTRAEAAAK